MSRWLAIAKSGRENTEPLPDICTKPYKTREMQPEVGFCQVVSNCPVGVEETVEVPADAPDADAFEERSAIHEHLGELSRADAEDLAAQSQGYLNVVTFRAAQANSTKGNEK